MKAYIAAPFFTPEQNDVVEDIKAILVRRGIDFFSPKDFFVVPTNACKQVLKRTFEMNLSEMNCCDCVVAVTDGKDMGTIFECGYAFAKNIPVFYIALTLGNNKFNLMLAESAYGVYRSMEEFRMAMTKIEAFGINSAKEDFVGAVV